MRKKKGPGGRPAKICDEITVRIQEALSQGLTIKEACNLAGISYSTLYRWRKIGFKRRRGIYRAFFRTIEQVFLAERDEKGRRTHKSHWAEHALKKAGIPLPARLLEE